MESFEQREKELKQKQIEYMEISSYLRKWDSLTEEEFEIFILLPETQEKIDRAINEVLPFYEIFFKDGLKSALRLKRTILKMKGFIEWQKTKDKTFLARLKNFLSK